ncbi:52 kDa repressor of the inhibitor of the protein kinase-like [Venturia canescens]|uniref:52 kDa repressor of the inhibitor of the protein kinase-like n=1 Tax=Venturia canescens TaxID=32260 RepID=UPI001C9D5392|nr:52 kDa repressor of the inhibitor of the protein kinase-like [Venturia canescens]
MIDTYSAASENNDEKKRTGQILDTIEEEDTENECTSAGVSIYTTDAADWPMPVPDHIRLEIVKQGSEIYQHKEGPFVAVERPGGHAKGSHRNLTTSWFYLTLKNGTKYLRKWMIYSASGNNIHCFCCRVFASINDMDKQFVSGFQQWWKLNPKIFEHEFSSEHLSNLEKWKTLAGRLKLNKTIDQENQNIINQEAKKWREILHRLLDITLFLAQQNLAFRGHREDVLSKNRGNFLELVKLMAKYDPVLKEHWLKLRESAGGVKRVPSYLSKTIQNEFIALLGDHVKKKIVDDIKKSKYFGIIFDSTPDNSHTDQMSEIIRYVHIEGDVVEVRESFLGFFSFSGKTAADISESILKQLEKDGLNIENCRAQGYDNAASMAGIHGGVQQKIKDINPKALFTPCANHSLNLCGVHSFGSVPSSLTFFGTLERLYSFFSVSTHRWEMLSQKVGKSVKRLSVTRWSAHHDAVNAVKGNVEQLVNTIQEMCDPSKENLDTKSAASVLIPAVCSM